MSHLYPLATSASAALAEPGEGARTRNDAKALAAGRNIAGLRSDWLNYTPDEAEALSRQIERGVDMGFVQRYEDAGGRIVLAVTYWGLEETSGTSAKPAPAAPKPKPKAEDDHTDDLYFRRGRTRPRGRKRYRDPNQLDLFQPPEDEPKPEPKPARKRKTSRA